MSTSSSLSDTNTDTDPKSQSVIDCEFLTLVKRHFKNNPEFDLWSYLGDLLEFDSSNVIGDIDITKILPGAVLLSQYEDYNIGYHSRECTAKKLSIYQYDGRYIKFSFDLEAAGIESDLLILSIDHHYPKADIYNGLIDRNSIRSFFNDTIDIRKRMRCSEVIEKNNILDLSFIIDLYAIVHGEKGEKRFCKYMRRRYAKRERGIKAQLKR